MNKDKLRALSASVPALVAELRVAGERAAASAQLTGHEELARTWVDLEESWQPVRDQVIAGLRDVLARLNAYLADAARPSDALPECEVIGDGVVSDASSEPTGVLVVPIATGDGTAIDSPGQSLSGDPQGLADAAAVYRGLAERLTAATSRSLDTAEGWAWPDPRWADLRDQAAEIVDSVYALRGLYWNVSLVVATYSAALLRAKTQADLAAQTLATLRERRAVANQRWNDAPATVGAGQPGYWEMEVGMLSERICAEEDTWGAAKRDKETAATEAMTALRSLGARTASPGLGGPHNDLEPESEGGGPDLGGSWWDLIDLGGSLVDLITDL